MIIFASFVKSSTKKNNSFLFHCLLAAIMALLLSACSDGGRSVVDPNSQLESTNDSGESLSEIEETSFKGRVVKGVISNAIIKVYPIIEVGDEYRVDFESLPVTTRTNGSGYYQVKPSRGKKDRYYYLEMITDDSSQMMCDYHEGCAYGNSGGLVSFGEAFFLPNGLTLSNIVKSKAGKISHAPISPLTHLATKYMAGLSGGYSPSNIATAEQYIEAEFGLGDRALRLTPSDLTSLSEIKRLKEQELKLGVISASFMPLIDEQGWDVLETLPIAELILNASKLAGYLAGIVDTPQQRRAVLSVEDQIYDHYSSLAESFLEIESHPVSVSATESDDVLLSVTANSSETISYQWRKDGTELPGAINSHLLLANVDLSQTGAYSVAVSNQYESLVSLSALVSVTAEPEAVSISVQPFSISAVEGQSVYLEVEANGDGPLSYQWQKGGSIISGATTSKLNWDAINLNDEGTYSVTVSNSVSSLQSEFATVSVIGGADPIVILEQPLGIDADEGDAVSFSVSASGGGFITYQWRKNGLGIANANSSSFSKQSALPIDSGSYDVVVANSVGSTISQAAILNVEPYLEPVSIVQQPQPILLNEGGFGTLSVLATGGGSLNYQWLKNGTALSNSNNSTLTISDAKVGDQGNYQVAVSNEKYVEQSQTAFVSVTPAPLPETVQVQLSWSIPNAREDGSILDVSEIHGYYIEYGTDISHLNQTLDVSGGVTTQTYLDLLPANYYLRIATIDVNGTMGQFSDAIQITVN